MNISACLRMRTTEPSIHTPRVFATTVSNSVVYVDTLKKEVTWYSVLRHYDAEDSGTTTDNLESIQEVVIWRVCYIILRNSDGNRYILYLYWNDGQWNWNMNWLGNDWNDNNPSAVLATHFISLPTLCWESFVLRVARAIHQAFYLFRLLGLKEQYIFYYQ